MKLIQQNLKVKPNTNTAKSAILFVGDDMGITTLTAARILDGQMKNHLGEDNVLIWEEFPWSALVKTYCLNLQAADSASSATAILNGVKTNDSKKRNIIRGYNVAWVPFRNEFRGLNIPPHYRGFSYPRAL